MLIFFLFGIISQEKEDVSQKLIIFEANVRNNQNLK